MSMDYEIGFLLGSFTGINSENKIISSYDYFYFIVEEIEIQRNWMTILGCLFNFPHDLRKNIYSQALMPPC